MRLGLGLQIKRTFNSCVYPFENTNQIVKLMIGRASHVARPSLCPVTESLTSHVLYHLLAQR